MIWQLFFLKRRMTTTYGPRIEGNNGVLARYTGVLRRLFLIKIDFNMELVGTSKAHQNFYSASN